MTALGLWAAFAFVTWNVVFDRYVYRSAVGYTQEQIQRRESGKQVSSIEEAFMPELSRAARRATVWGGAVLATGVALTLVVSRRSRSR